MKLSVSTIPDRSLGSLTNVSYDIENRLFLTPDNLLRDTGDPRNIDPGVTGHEDGFHVYLGFSWQDMVRQTLSALPLSRSTFFAAIFDSSGHAPPVGIPPLAKAIGIPLAPILKDVAVTGGGYKLGAHLVSYTGVDAAGKHTLLAPTTDVHVDVNGEYVSVPFPQNISAAYSGVGVWFNDPGSATLYLQRVVDLSRGRPATYELTGPMRYDKLPPSANETYLGKSRSPEVDKDSAPYTLRAGNYSLYKTDVTRAGENLPSSAVTYSRSSNAASSALYVYPKDRPPSAVGWFCYALQKDGRAYVVHPVNSSPEKPLSYNQMAQVYSYDPTTWPKDASGNPVGWTVTPRALPLVDASGLPNPNDPVDPPTTYGGSGLHVEATVKTLRAAFTFTQGGVEGPRSLAGAISIAANRAARVIAPKRVNRLRNSQQAEFDPTGVPSDLVVVTANGTVTHEPGRTTLTTAIGTSTGTTPSLATSPVTLDRTLDYRPAGLIEVSDWLAGRVEAVLQEYSGAEVTGTLLRETILSFETGNLDISGDGAEEYWRTILASENFWHASTVSWRILHRFAGADKRLSMRIANLAAFPHEHRPIKFERTAARLLDKLDVPFEWPYPEGISWHVAYTQRKVKAQQLRPQPLPDSPILPGVTVETWGFEAGEDRSAMTLTVDGGATAAVEAGSAIEGSAGWHIASADTASLSRAFYARTVPPPTGYASRHSLGDRVRYRVRALPPSGTSIEILRLTNAAGTATLGSVHLEAGGTVRVRGFNASGASVLNRRIATGVAVGDVIAPELVAQGGGTDEGTLRCWFSRNGAADRLLAEVEKVAWDTLRPERYAFGVISESSAAATWDLDVDVVRVTEHGSTWVYEKDVLGNSIPIGHLFVPAWHDTHNDMLPKGIRLAVKPGQTYALSVYMRHVGLKSRAWPFWATAHLVDGGIVEMGSPVGANGITGTGGWKEHQMTFTVPKKGNLDAQGNPYTSDCYEIRIAGRDIGRGSYFYQDPCMSEGTSPRRTLKTATSGSFRTTFRTSTPRAQGARIPRTWLRAGMEVASQPAGTSTTLRFRAASEDRDGNPTGYTDYTTDVQTLPHLEFLEVEGFLYGDGFTTPVIASRSPYLEQELTYATLLREDGTEFDGGAIITDLQTPSSLTPVDVRQKLNRRVERHVLAAPVGSLGTFKLQVFTEAAKVEIEETCMTHLLRVEGRGRSILIKPREQILLRQQPATQTLSTVDGKRYYHVYATADVAASEVVEESRL